MGENDNRSIAIACQGGGSHTAFTAGVLKRILKENKKQYEITSLSGTSGGAICAMLAWYGLLTNDKDKSIRLLDSFWTDLSANSFQDMLLNWWVVWTSRMNGVVPTLEISPYYYPPWAQEYMKGVLEKHVEFNKIKMLVDSNPSCPDLFVGAVDVLSGKFKVFQNAEIGADAILASAAIPTFLRAVNIDSKVYWDGLFSQNPPVRDFIGDEIHTKPDEIWVIQINPQNRLYEPKSVEEIVDRRNELAGNLSLYQEIDFIEAVNKWVEAGYLPDNKYKHIDVRWIGTPDGNLDIASKLDRSPQFIRYMMAYGEKQAEDFLAHY
ncbi:putative esterase of the alpha-beta hydrolase superfamily [Candidatus Methanoperedens nitroreducens]|uniref:Putative esterase of the alpha-beta hydrolase superfamily n=1 Tax=Candidatus Methanoperedens nitratireducens TaxID=1392998 RepID=A0A062V5C0_9EURY|nr:patatin-like phospholipase family protein [Candidatus Methanoperedens nitroreducens]KCZ71798.1 putative esterase of the alpha-beta hydrolase superfamily [Candidatus Methanoperedens nitroreducens]MDJ1422228.1 patatin-like phospholipase family protein [Candidatus Methanoperedens sp.]